jgi:hypothetical protein
MGLSEIREVQGTRVHQAWYDAPRPPASGEREYLFWYQVAQDYNRLVRLLPEPAESAKKPDHPRKHFVLERNPPDFSGCTDWRNFYGTILPALQQLLLARTATIEFAYLWGRFCLAAADFAVEAASRDGHADLTAELLKRRGPLKWYLHWRRYYEARGLSMHRANADFLTIAHEIVCGVRPAPPGFSPAWFQSALCRGENKTPRRALPHAFKRAHRLGCAHQLLKSPVDEEPPIPPLGLAAYSPPLCAPHPTRWTAIK